MRISVTTIEQFRRYVAGITSLGDLIEGIKGTFTPTAKMQLGTAAHAIIENPEAYKVYENIHGENSLEMMYKCDDIYFPADAIEPCIGVMDYSGDFEVKTTKEYSVFGEPVTVVAKCDQLIGMMVIENKPKWSPFDYNGYYDSCQWRFYLDIFNVHGVRYNVFCMNNTQSRGIELNSIETFSMHDYVGLQDDITRLLSDFVYFIKQQNLEQYFQPKA